MLRPMNFMNSLVVRMPQANGPLRTNPRATHADLSLPASITRAASTQTYYTIRFLVDRDRVTDAYRAYAYFRWVDDTLDQGDTPLAERLAFVERQQVLMRCMTLGLNVSDLPPEEQLLVNLMHNHPEQNSGLSAYMENMMRVMAFDAERRGKVISQQELEEYTRWLATAVTEAMHYFIGHDRYSPCGEARYRAVTGAHITHMLRDTLEDVEAGYYNIAREFLDAQGVDPDDIHHPAYHEWVRGRVQQARDCFNEGRKYLAEVESLRCRMAGYAYTVRFELVLDAIERDSYRLRRDYPERKNVSAAMKMMGSALVGGARV